MKMTTTTPILVSLFLTLSLGAETYHIGTGQAYESIGDFTGWTSLQPGDTVFIHHRAEPYREHILLCQSGTQENPIVIQGVPDEDGNLPVISGDNAIIPPQFDGHLHSTTFQGFGIIYVHRSMSDDPWGTEPEWIEIRNLEVMSATPEPYTFTNSEGVSGQVYPNGSSGIYIKTGNHILVENCTIHDCGNGLHVQGVDAMAHDITIRNCHIYGNGRTGGGRADREHNIYTEASGITIEYCLIGRLREGSGGIAIKDRSANTVIRYNKIYSGARALDLVEPENQSTHDCETNEVSGDGMHEEPGFDTTWVYGNLIINGPSNFLTSGNMIHYGADNCPNTSRSGMLKFYNNTVYTDLDANDQYYTRLFDITSSRETVELRNNVFYNAGSSIIYFAFSTQYSTTGTINWEGGNWITSGYTNFYPGDTGVWNETVPPIEGENTGVLTDPANGDFSLPPGSSLISQGTALPAEILANHPVNKEYHANLMFLERLTTLDIGAFESTTGIPANTAPVMTAIGDQNVQSGQTLTIVVEASDADENDLEYSAVGALP